MGLNLMLGLVGLAAAAAGLRARGWTAALAPLGWGLFLIGLVRVLVPGFF